MKQSHAATSGAGNPPLSPALRAEAAAWVARLHSSGSRSRSLEAGFRRWLQADPANARAFELATEAWDIVGSLSSQAMPRIPRAFRELTPRRAYVRPWWAVAAAVTLFALGTLFYVNRLEPTVSTDVGEQRLLTLDDGTRIFLNTATRLVVKEGRAKRVVQLQSGGEAFFDVVHDARRPFVVEAGDQKIVSLGTSFVVRRDPEKLSVTLMEGKVAVSDSSIVDNLRSVGGEGQRVSEGVKGAIVLTPGRRVTLVKNKPPSIDAPEIEKVTAWLRREVILDKTPLPDAIAEMNRYSSVKLSLEDRQAADIRVSGIFRVGDSARFAQAVGETYDLQLDHREREIVIFRSAASR